MTDAPSPALQIDVYSHHFEISHMGPEVRHALAENAHHNLSQWGPTRGPGGSVRQIVKCVFIAKLENETRYNFVLGQWDEIMEYLTRCGIQARYAMVTKHEPTPGVPVEFTLKQVFVPRSYQPAIIQYLVDPGPNKMVELQTGKGKTALALKAVHEIGTRALLIIRPMYIDKWVSDVEGFFDLEKGDLMVARGGANLKRMIDLAKAGELEAKFIIMSNATLRMFLDEHEQFNGDVSSYGIAPQELASTLGAGLVIFDEVHQDFHFNYRMISYLNVPKTIALSATMEADDPMLNTRYMVTFPPDLRAPAVEYDKYITVEALFYQMESMEKVRYKNFFKQYNHAMYEGSIMKHPRRLANYKQMVAKIVNYEFCRVYQPGMRCAVYFSTVEMCTIMQAYLSGAFPHKKVLRYVSEDDYSNLMEADIAITTMQSAGTAVDIPNLAINFMTVALNSKQANIQGLGRLRRLADFPDFTPKFLYTVCTSIEKHVRYHQDKVKKFKGKVLGHRELQTPFRI